MKTKVILVYPEYPENIGLIARAMKNFGFEELLIVKPQCKILDGKAKSRAMHGIDVLKKAKIFSSLDNALKQVDFSAATTAKKAHSEKKLFRTAITPKTLAEKFSKTNAVLGIVFGREDSGLTNQEILQCDFVVSIPANKKYSTLNISHAAAVILYELFSAKKTTKLKTVKKMTKKILLEKIKKLISASKTIQNRKSVLLSFKALLGRAIITEKEARAMLALLSELEQKN